MTRVLITGACGHVGSAIMRVVPWEITAYDNLHTQRYASLFGLPRRIRFIEANIRDDRAFSEAIEGQDAVVHLAALTNAAESMGQDDAYLSVNAHGTDRVARICANNGVPLVFVSTTSVYGEQADAVDESLDVNSYRPESPYAYAKRVAELTLPTIDGLRYTILRCGTIYGTSPGMRLHTFVNKACWLAAQGLPIPIYKGAWDSLRPYLALSECVDELTQAVETPRHGVRNVLTGNHTPREVVSLIRQYLPEASVSEVDAPFLNQRGYEVRSLYRPTTDPQRASYVLSRGIRSTLALLRPDVPVHPPARQAVAA